MKLRRLLGLSLHIGHSDPHGKRMPVRSIYRFSALLPFVCLLCSFTVFGQQQKQFRVCADPENMPFSDRRLEGFENKIAAVIAKEFGATPSYIWWAQRRGFIRNTMNASLKEMRCDYVIGVPQGYD